jgi:hypothetical protein
MLTIKVLGQNIAHLFVITEERSKCTDTFVTLATAFAGLGGCISKLNILICCFKAFLN